jgi:hypothetical protein
MGTLSFETMQNYALFQLGGPTRTELLSPTNYVARWVNDAYRDLTTKNRYMGLRKNFVFPTLEVSTTDTTVDGQGYVSTPTDCLIVRHVFDTTNTKKLERINWFTHVSYTDRATAASEGKPTEWVRSAGNIYLHPTPDDAYDLEIFYKKIPSSMSASADVTLIGDEWDNIIVQLAVIKGHIWMNDWEKVKSLKEVWLEDVSAMLGLYDNEERDMRPQVKGDSSYNDYGYKG